MNLTLLDSHIYREKYNMKGNIVFGAQFPVAAFV